MHRFLPLCASKCDKTTFCEVTHSHASPSTPTCHCLQAPVTAYYRTQLRVSVRFYTLSTSSRRFRVLLWVVCAFERLSGSFHNFSALYRRTILSTAMRYFAPSCICSIICVIFRASARLCTLLSAIAQIRVVPLVFARFCKLQRAIPRLHVPLHTFGAVLCSSEHLDASVPRSTPLCTAPWLSMTRYAVVFRHTNLRAYVCCYTLLCVGKRQ